jgi:hypothetical protein
MDGDVRPILAEDGDAIRAALATPTASSSTSR